MTERADAPASGLQRVRANLRRAYESGRETVRTRREEAARRAENGNGGFQDEPPPEAVEETHSSTSSRDDADVPRSLRIGAAWAWRLIVLGVLVWALIRVIGVVRIVVIPLVIAMLLSALLAPAVRRLLRLGLPRSLATAVVLIGGIAAVAGTLTLVITEFIDGLPQLTDSATAGVRQIQEWLQTGPLHLSESQLDSYIDTGEQWLEDNTESLTSGAVSTATTLFEVLTGMFLVLFSTFFFLRDGDKIWRFLVRLLPLRARWQVDDAGRAGWLTLVAYVRATVLVAFIDAVGIGVAVWILGIPFPLPLAALVFLGAFIPIVGATLSGAVAVLIALVDSGWVSALILLGAVIAVQQLEGHVLQPLIMGRAVAIHPLAVIVAIAAGVVLAGIVGALVAVPLVAVLNTAIRRLTHPRRPELPPDAVVVASTPS
ncbi:AI-2E family transporter [Phytohabitans rumicis]|uniref:AI-2E family transporter n=1 Tax=Phytohabitans rumicis TaxID=1076125 RepID=A0A6V8L473_9ACTN|nr:AI-2E family transporter [Phytohabitans rumicis]GFJ90994.1 AI-2E family transporter [Phytohabitans rumicis]